MIHNRWTYLSYPLSVDLSGYGNGARISVCQTRSITNGDSSNNTEFCMSSHFGTHIDFPNHFSNKGKTIEDYEEHLKKLKREIEMRELSSLVRPCKFAVLKGYTFRQSNPAIVGVEVEIGQIKTGDPIMNLEGKKISSVKSMQEGKDHVNNAQQGKQIAMAMEGVTVGRQVEEGDFLYADLSEEDFKKLKILKQHLSKMEVNVLKEIAEIKRKQNPVWGIG